MHSRDLAELAALVAVESPAMIRSGGQVSYDSVQQYWSASRCRMDRWGRLLRQLTAAAGQPVLPATLSWPRVRPVLEEILASELLTRLWTAAACAYDLARGDQDLSPVARNIYAGHLEARRRLLALLAEGRAIHLPDAVKLDQLRRRVERWTDMLLAHLAPLSDIEQFAFEPARASDFAEDLDHESIHAEPRFTSQLVLASLRASFTDGLSDRTPNADLNRRIGSAILGALRDEMFDSASLVKSLWLQRLDRTASDTEGMIDELVRLDRDPSPL